MKGTIFAMAMLVSPAVCQQEKEVRLPRRFEVVSIKPSKPGAVMQDMRINFPPGRMEALNITLNELLLAFSGFSGRVEGGPKWAESERYDIIAKAEGEIAPAERNAMTLALLEDRFKLAVHHETREEAGLALMKGRGSPEMEPAKDGEESLIRMNSQRQVVFTNINMARLASYLRSMWGTPVIDRTGIAGNFDFSLDPQSFADEGGSFSDRVRPAVEALGFRLEPVRVGRDVTIIERVERPTEN